MANVTLDDVKAQLIANQQENTDANIKSHEILKGIATQFSSYFQYLKQSRLDELEKQRELKNQAASTKPVTTLARQDDDESYTNPFGMIGKIGAIGAAVAGSIAGVLETYRKFWVNQNTFVGRALSRSFTNFGLGFTNVGKEINAGFRGVQTLAIKDFSTLSGKIGAITKSITTELTKPFLLVKGAVEAVQSRGNRFFKAIMIPFTAVGKFFTDLVDIFKNARLPTTTGIIDGFTGVIDRLGIFGRFLKGTFSLLKNTVKRVLAPLVALYGAVTGFMDTEGNTFQKILGAIKGAFQSFVQFIFVDFGRFILDGIAGIFRFFNLDTIANAFNSISEGIQAVFTTLMDSLQLLIEDPTQFANQLLGMVKNGFNTTVQVVGDFFTNVFDSVMAGIKAIAINPVGFAASLLGPKSRKLLGLEDNYQEYQDARNFPERPDIPERQAKIDKQLGKSRADEMKALTDTLANMQLQTASTVAINAPSMVTTSNTSNNVTSTGSSSATDRKAPEG